ncbi:MAG: polysaccharide deacetylase family protein [Clostridiales bacterium]|nr:polysaccharide deacetylase family protein [Clostridiales bacterium]
MDVSSFRQEEEVKVDGDTKEERKGLEIVGNEDKVIENVANTDEEYGASEGYIKGRKDTDTFKYQRLKGEINSSLLDRVVLEKEENDKHAWWLRLNGNHEVSGIDPYAERLIQDYDIIYAGDTSKKIVYLTFDEGYENGYTPMILDTLKENDVSAIFFITGAYLKKNPDLVKRMLDEGHEVGSHSVNHPSFPDLAFKDYDKLESEMLDLEQEFYDKFGIGFKYIRPPRGEYSKRTLKAAMQMGYKNVFWSYAYKDYDVNDQRGEDYAYNKVMDHLHNGMVVLLHAVSKDNANALDRMIKDIKSNGYTIAPFDL